MKANIISILILGCIQTAIAQDTCILSQKCARTPEQEAANAPCPNAMDVLPPTPDAYAPSPITDGTAISNLATACPFLNPATPLCCGDDTAAVLQSNFQSLDAVFLSDCPICAVNLKVMWCEYACNPLKAGFLEYLGDTVSGGKAMTEVNFNVDSDYACGLFTSCKQESFIAIAGISSSIAFLDFLGVNGQNTSLSIITFNLTTDMSYPDTLEGTATACETTIASDGILSNYTDVSTCSCSYCAKVCAAPEVDNQIGFLDGFSWKRVGYSYIGFISFTILYQLGLYFFRRNKRQDQIHSGRINVTTSTMGGVSQDLSDLKED